MKPPRAVHVLFGNKGEYSDRREWVVRAYVNKADAEHDGARLNAMVGEASAEYQRLFDEDWEAAQGIVARLTAHDANVSDLGYYVPEYHVAEIPLVTSQQVPDAPNPAR